MTSHKNNLTFGSCLFPLRQHLHVVNPQTQLWLLIIEGGRWWLNPTTSSGTWFSSFASPVSWKASKGMYKRKHVKKNRRCRRNIPISLEQKVACSKYFGSYSLNLCYELCVLTENSCSGIFLSFLPSFIP